MQWYQHKARGEFSPVHSGNLAKRNLFCPCSLSQVSFSQKSWEINTKNFESIKIAIQKNQFLVKNSRAQAKSDATDTLVFPVLTGTPYPELPHAPQGYVADGDDGSHWVVVDDKGTADCEGEVTYTAGDIGLGYCTQKKNPMSDIRKFSPKLMTLNPRLFCGYFTCTGVLNLVCDGMLSGCHG